MPGTTLKWQWPFGRAATTGILLFPVAFTLLWIALLKWDPEVYRENGPMENFQVACLAAGMLVWALWSWRSSELGVRILFGGLILLYLTFLVRELDLRHSDLAWLHKLLHGRTRDVWLGGCWLAAFILFWRNRRAVWNVFVPWLSQPAGALLLLAGGGWILGGLIDQLKLFDTNAHNLLAEELFEVNAAATMLASAVTERWVKKPTPGPASLLPSH